MRKWLPLTIIFAIFAIFFYKTIFLFQVPFPGDLLVSEYAPWKYESFLGYNPGSYPNKAQYFDVIRQLYPWKVLAIDELREGRLPLWNPYNFSGSPLLANNQSSVFNPFNFLFFVFNNAVSWSLYILAQPLLACIFTYYYLKNRKLSPVASLLGAVSYSFSLFMMTFIEYGNFGHTIMWLPLLLLIVDRKVDKLTLIFPLIISIVIFSGHLQLAAGVLFVTFLYICFFANHRRLLLALFITGIGLSSIQLVPTVELIANSSRVSHDISNITQNFLIQIHQLILFVSPDSYGNPATRNYILKDTYPGNALYLGIAPFLFSIIAVFLIRKNKYVAFFSALFAASLLFLTNNPLTQLVYQIPLPIISSSSPSNFIFILTFCLSILSAFGFSVWEKKKDFKTISLALGTIGFFIIIFVYHKLAGIEIITKQVILSGIFVGIVLCLFFADKFIRNKHIAFFFIAITVIELFFYAQKFNPFVSSKLMYPQTTIGKFLDENGGLDKFWGVGAGTVESNFATHLRIFSPEGYDPLYPKWYAQYIGSSKSTFNMRSDAKIDQPDLKSAISGDFLMEKLNHLGVKFILDRVENASSEVTFPDDKFEKTYQKNGWIVMKNKTYLPKAYTVDNKNNKTSAQIISYEPGEIVLRPNTNGKLILSETYFPGWYVYIDGRRREAFRVNEVFLGAGNVSKDSTVKFSYEPLSFKWGLIITIISIGGVLVTGIVIKRKEYEK